MFPSGSFLHSVRVSSKATVERANIKVNTASIDRFLDSAVFTEANYASLSSSYSFTFPLNFESDVDELNLIGLFALLSLSSSFDESLYQHTNRGVFDSIRAFVFSLYLSSSSSEGDDLLSARGMQNITRERVAEHMQLSIHEEKPHPTMPAITVGGIGGPHLNFVELVTRVLQETGGVLRETGYPNLGTFIARALVDAERAGRSSGATSPDPDVVVQHLVRAFPSFQDSYSVQNQPVFLFRKAILLVLMIAGRFRSSSDVGQIALSPLDAIPAPADDILPSILIHLAILDLSDCTIPALLGQYSSADPSSLLAPTHVTADSAKAPTTTTQLVLSDDEATVLRAASVYVLDAIVSRAKHADRGEGISDEGNTDGSWKTKVTSAGLCAFFSAIVQERNDYRQLPRYVAKGAIF